VCGVKDEASGVAYVTTHHVLTDYGAGDYPNKVTQKSTAKRLDA